jgi:hypothetical protein
MTASALALAATFTSARLYAQTDHPDHSPVDHASHDAPSHDSASHETSSHDASDHDRAQETMDRNMQNAKDLTKAQAEEKDREQMRNKDHDDRLKVSDHTSVGGGFEPGGASVNVKTDIDPPSHGDHPTK